MNGLDNDLHVTVNFILNSYKFSLVGKISCYLKLAYTKLEPGIFQSSSAIHANLVSLHFVIFGFGLLDEKQGRCILNKKGDKCIV
jgi:hypothetical protein